MHFVFHPQGALAHGEGRWDNSYQATATMPQRQMATHSETTVKTEVNDVNAVAVVVLLVWCGACLSSYSFSSALFFLLLCFLVFVLQSCLCTISVRILV